MLLLKRHLVELVRSGKKRQTIRLWSRAMVRPGQITYTPGLGRLKIITVDQLAALGDLSEADAIADGFTSRTALLEEIARIYGHSPQGRTIFRIRFEWPIDEAGELLVTAPATVESAPARKTSRATKPTGSPRAGTPAMTTDQRRVLQKFVLSRKPAR